MAFRDFPEWIKKEYKEQTGISLRAPTYNEDTIMAIMARKLEEIEKRQKGSAPTEPVEYPWLSSIGYYKNVITFTDRSLSCLCWKDNFEEIRTFIKNESHGKCVLALEFANFFGQILPRDQVGTGSMSIGMMNLIHMLNDDTLVIILTDGDLASGMKEALIKNPNVLMIDHKGNEILK